MLDRINNLIDQLQSHTGYDTFGIRERTLKGAESNPRLLGGHTRE